MKQFMFWVAALAMVFFTSCQQEQTPVTENAIVNFSISTPAIGTRADEFDTTGKDVASYGDGATVNVLKYALYEAEINDDGTVKALIGDAKPGTKANAFPEKATETTIEGVSAIKGKTYAAFFWAEAEGDPYKVEWTAEGPIATLNDAAALANNENLDAFFGVHTFTLEESGQLEDNIYLKRPFAQLNIATTDKSDAEAAKVTVTETEIELTAPNSLNLLTGRTIGTTTVKLEMSAIPEDMYVDLDKDGKYDLLSFNYIFVDGDPYTANDQTKVTDQEVTFRYKYLEDAEDVKEYTFDGITLQRNHRTYVVGSLLTEVVTFYVKINPVWDDSHIYHGDGTGSTPPAAVDVSEPVIIDNATMNGYERVQLSWEVGDDVAKTIVSWGENDSETTEFAITQSNASMDKFLTTRAEGKRMTETIEVDEGEYTFKLVNVDANGNKSDAVTVDLKAYGQNWYSTLVTRPVKSVVFDKNNSQATVTFEETWANKADCSITTLTYTNKDSETATKQITNAVTEVVCDNIALGATISITSSYKPDNYIPDDTKVSPAIEKVTELIVNLRVMTLNAKNQYETWVSRAAQIANLIKDMDVDIMGLQELNYAESWMYEQNATKAFNILLNNLGSDYAGVVYEREASYTDHEGEAIIYKKTKFTMNSEGRFWLSLTPDTAGKFTQKVGETTYTANYERFAIWSVITDIATGKEFCFANTHIDNKNLDADAATDYYLMKTQVGNMVNHIQARSSSTDSSNNVLRPIIIVGDFNANPGKSPITTMTGRQYSDTYTEAVKKEYPSELAGPYARATMHDSGTPNWAAYDYIFARGGSFTVPLHKICHPKYNNVELSDHMAVIVDMQYTFTE